MDENDKFDPSGDLTPVRSIVQTPELHSLDSVPPVKPDNVATPTEAEFSDFNPSHVTPVADISKQIDQSAHDLYAAYKAGRVDLPQSWVKDLEKQSDDGTKPSDSLVNWLGTVAKLSLLSSPPALAAKAGELAVSPQARADASKFISDNVVAPVKTGLNAAANVAEAYRDLSPQGLANPAARENIAQTEKELAYGPPSGIAGLGEAGYDLATGFANIAQEGTPGAEERRIAGNVAAANLHHDLSKVRQAATDVLNINPDAPVTKTSEFLSQAALPIGIEGKVAPAIAKASDFLVDQTPKIIGKGLQAVGATGEAAALPAAAAATLAAGHPALALGELLTGYNGTFAGRMRKAILDKTFGKVGDLGAKLASTPDNVTIIGGLRNEALNKAENLKNVEQTLRAKYADKLEHVDDPNFDIEHLTGPDKQVRQAMDDAKEFQQRADSLKFYEDVNKIMSSGAKLATNISGQSAVTGAVVSAITAAQAQPEDVGKATESGFRAGQLLGLPGAAIGAPGAMRDLRAARNADALAQIGKGAIAGSPDFEAHNENINRLSPKEQRRIDVLNGMGAPLGVKTILLNPEQLLQKSIATDGQAPEVIGEKPPKQGGPAVAPNAIIDGNNIYLNSEQGTGPWGHEITHAIEKTLGKGAVTAMSNIGARVADPTTSQEYKDFAARYLEAMQKTISNYPALSNDQISSEAFAEIGRRVLHETPPELFYGGESGGDVLGRWANHIAGKLAPDWYNSLKADPVFGAPYSRADVQNVKGAMFELGEKAARGAKPPVEAVQPEPSIPVPDGAVKALISIGSGKTKMSTATAQARAQAAVGDLIAQGKAVNLENVVRQAMIRSVPKEEKIAAEPTTKVTPPPIQTPISQAEVPPPKFEETADGFKFMPVTRDGITSPAVQTDDGMIFKGKTHAEAEQAAKSFGAKNPVRGFVNRKGFLTADEASTQGVQTGQLPQGMEEKPLSVNGFNKNRQFMPRVSPMGFFSNLEKTIEEKMPKRASAEQVRGIISGLKKDEIKWSGIDDFLKDNPHVTKEQVMEFLRENNLSPTEILKGAGERERFETDTAGIQKAYDYLQEKGYDPNQLNHDYTDNEIVDKANAVLEQNAGKSDTKFGAHVLPGGKNYRELLLTLPTPLPEGYSIRPSIIKNGAVDVIDPKGYNAGTWNTEAEARKALARFEEGKNFTDGHFNEPNVVAHVRFNDRIGPDGEKILHIEEAQSDWAAQGRKLGIGPQLKDGEEMAVAGVPDAPFIRGSWPALTMKRMIRYAAENSYDKLTWTTGEQQAERYDLSKQVHSIATFRQRDGRWDISAKMPNGSWRQLKNNIDAKDLAGTVGKDLAEKISKQKSDEAEYTGADLKVGGEWAKNLYDRTLVNTANDLGKKFGAKAGETKIETKGREYFLEGRTAPGENWQHAGTTENKAAAEAALKVRQDKYPQAQWRLSSNEPETKTVHSLPITPEMRKSVMEQGQPLFMPPAAVPKESVRRIRANGGITVNLQGDEPTKGFAFSPLKNMEAKYPIGSLSEDNLRQYLRDHREALSQAGAHIGGWDNGQGQAVLDVSVVHPDKLEALVRAKNARQDAIYDLASHKEIPTNEGLNDYSPEQIAAAEKELNPPQQDTTGGVEGLRGSGSGSLPPERSLEKATVSGFAAGEPPMQRPGFEPGKKRTIYATQDSKGQWVVNELINVGGGEMGAERLPGGPYPDEAAAEAAVKQIKNEGGKSQPEPPSWLLHFMPSSNPEAIKTPAVKYKDGTVRAMRFHYEFSEKPGQIDGYLLNNGKFLNKVDAEAQAEKIGQIVNYKQQRGSPGLESLAFKEQRKFMPKSDWWDHAQQYLTPEERDSIRDQGIDKITKLFSKLSPEKGAEMALKGEVKKDWYRNSAQEISNIFGPDANRFSALLAALSPQTSPLESMRNALNVWAGWLEAGRPTDPNGIKDIIGREVEQTEKTKEASALPAWIPNSVRALSTADAIKLSGPKVDSFYHNLSDNVNEVTQDRWMQYYATGTKTPFKARRLVADEKRATKGFDYLALNAHIREVADLLTKQTGDEWTPSETQAAIWSYIKPLGEKAAKLGITPEELMKGEGITKKDILASSQDFSDILKANENQPRLQRIKTAAPADFQGLPARAEKGSGQGLAGAAIPETGPATKTPGVKFMPSGVTPTKEIPKRAYPVTLAQLNGHAGEIMAERAALLNYDGFSVKQPDGSTKYFKIDTNEFLGNNQQFMPSSVPPELQLSPVKQKNIDDLTQKVRILNNQLQRYAATSAQPTLWDNPAAIKLSAQKQEMWNEIHKLRAGSVRDLVIIGSGPAGLTAAMNSAYDTVDTVLLEKQARLGGAPKDSSRIENTFGAAREGSTGQQLTRDATEKARNNGAEIRPGVGMAKLEVNTPVAGIHKITTTAHEEIYARHVLLTPGLTFDRLNVPGGELAISGNGRLAAIQAKGGTEIIVGGGNSASQAAIGAVESTGVKHVYLFARSGLGKMTVSQAEQLEVNGNIQIVKDEIAKIEKLEGGKLLVTSKQGHVYEVNSVGTFIGGKVNTQGLPEGIKIQQEKGEDQGKVMVDPRTYETNVPGVFVAGDAAVGSEGGGINLAVGSGAKVARVVSRRVYDAKRNGTYR